jgi:hypothetical protein
MGSMKAAALSLIAILAASPAVAQSSEHPIATSAAKAVAAVAVEQDSPGARHKLFWPGLALGVAGVATGVLAVTVARVEDNSSGNAPPTAYRACVAQKKDPIYATNDCGALKAKNAPVLAAGVALGAAGAGLMIAGSRTSAAVGPGVIRLVYKIRF